MSSTPRHTEISVRYTNSRTGKSYSLNDRVEEISVADNAVGEGDTADITVMNRDGRMTGDYFPGTDDMIDCTFFLYGSDGMSGVISHPSFHVDQISCTDSPSKMTLRGISVPKNSAFSKTPQTKTWQNISLSHIVWNVCSKNGLRHYYEQKSFDPFIKKVEQSGETDLSFLYNLCQTYGNGVKIYSDRLVVFSEAYYESKKTVRVIRPGDIIEGTFSAQFDLLRKYTGYEFEYDVGDIHWTQAHYFVTKPEIKIGIGQCESKEDGELKGCARVNNANRDMQLISFEIPGDQKMIPTAAFELSGFGALDGKYYINKVTNTVSASNGFTQSIEARKIQQRL